MQLQFRKATSGQPESSHGSMAGFLYGACFGAAATLGAAGMHKIAAEDGSPLRPAVFILLTIGSALLSGLIGLLTRHKPGQAADSEKGTWLIWPLSYFLIAGAGSAFMFLRGRGACFSNRLLINVFLLSFLSFGLAGCILGFCVLILQALYWRWLPVVHWGLGFACALGLLIGVSAGWAAYGWAIFSSQLLLSMGS